MKKLYVVGTNVSNSLSPTIFNYWFKKHNINAKYSFIELNNKNFDTEIKKILIDKNVIALNITIPFKKKIIKHIDFLDSHSSKIGAVNFVINGPKIKGYNTDWQGYYRSLPRNINLKNKKIIIFGYGGAAHSIHYLLKKKRTRKLVIINRTQKKLLFEKNKKTTDRKKIKFHLKNSDIIINTTPINPIEKKLVKEVPESTLISDIVYKPKLTKFLKQFLNNEKIYGIDMLIEQAIPCFSKCFSFKPTVDKELIKILDNKIK